MKALFRAQSCYFCQIFVKLADNLSIHKVSHGQNALFTLELPALIAEKAILDLLGMLDRCPVGDVLSIPRTG